MNKCTNSTFNIISCDKVANKNYLKYLYINVLYKMETLSVTRSKLQYDMDNTTKYVIKLDCSNYKNLRHKNRLAPFT